MIEAATATTKAKYGLVDETTISAAGMLAPGTFKALNFTTDSDTSNTFPTNATIQVTLAHAIAAGS